MKINIILIAVLITVILLFSENKWKDTSDLYSDGNVAFQFSNTDSCFYYNDSLYIANAETAYVHIPVKNTLGLIKIWGIITPLDTLETGDYGLTGDSLGFCGADTLYFDAGPHMGNGLIMNTGFTHTFTALDSAKLDTAVAGDFECYIGSNSTLTDKASVYYTFRIRGTANCFGRIYLVVEWIEAFKN